MSRSLATTVPSGCNNTPVAHLTIYMAVPIMPCPAIWLLEVTGPWFTLLREHFQSIKAIRFQGPLYFFWRLLGEPGAMTDGTGNPEILTIKKKIGGKKNLTMFYCKRREGGRKLSPNAVFGRVAAVGPRPQLPFICSIFNYRCGAAASLIHSLQHQLLAVDAPSTRYLSQFWVGYPLSRLIAVIKPPNTCVFSFKY